MTLQRWGTKLIISSSSKDTPKVALKSKLPGVCCKIFGEKCGWQAEHILSYYLFTKCPLGQVEMILDLLTQTNLRTHCTIALRQIPKNLTDETWTMGQLIVWCYQAKRHYPSQCWPRFIVSQALIGLTALKIIWTQVQNGLTDWRTDGRADGQCKTSISRFNFFEAGV